MINVSERTSASQGLRYLIYVKMYLHGQSKYYN